MEIKMKKQPAFAAPSSQHYSDYGFDPQIDYFQVLEEARKHGKRAEARGPLDGGLHFKLQKPISKDDSRAKSKKRKQWWKNAFLFWKRNAWRGNAEGKGIGNENEDQVDFGHQHAYTHRALSGPVYLVDSSASTTPCRSNRTGSGLLRFSSDGEIGIPYINLRDFNVMERHRASNASAHSKLPVYLVT